MNDLEIRRVVGAAAARWNDVVDVESLVGEQRHPADGAGPPDRSVD
jgi:hypothetical protein